MVAACPQKKVVKKTEPPEEAEEDVSSEELDIHGKDFVNSKKLENVYFGFDSTELSEEARGVLAANGEFLKKNENLEILSEGHCDQRGTVGYNLALGQRRAAAVRQYYLSLGIDPKRIGTLSFGNERLACMENTEKCWAENRRVETKVRAVKVVNGEDSKTPEENPATTP